jgi:signal transduction histidine kinase
MMTKAVTRLSLLLLLLLVSAKTGAASSIDSLRQVIASTSGDEKSDAYYKLHSELLKDDKVDEALAALEESIAFERQRNNEEEEGKSRWTKIVVLNNSVRDEALLAEAPVQMAWFEEHQQWDNYYNTWDCKASTYLYSNRPQTALHESKQMLEDAKKRNNNFGRAVSYQLTGIIYQQMGLNNAAIANLERAFNMLKRSSDSRMLFFTVCDYLAQTFDSDKNYERELQVTEEWLDAIERTPQAIKSQKADLMGTTLSCHIQRACALNGLERYDEAWQALAKAEECLEHASNLLTEYRMSACRARLLMSQHQLQAALLCLDRLDSMDLDVGGSVKELRAQTLQEMGRNAEAARLYRELYENMDSIFSRDMRSQLDELSTLYKLDEMAMKDQAERERQQNKFWMIITGIVFLTVMAFGFFRYVAAKRLAQKNRELQQANEQLRLANERVKDTSKMKTEFIKSISHEIRTPLNILAGFTQVITTPGLELPKEELADIHNRINENTDRIVQLVNKMMELSDANAQTVIDRQDNVSARDLIEDAVRRGHYASTDKVVFSWDSDDPLAATMLLTHRKYAVRALECLLENAWKFTKEGMIAVRLRKVPDRLLFIVEDTGIGVLPDQADYIFEEFVQIDKYTDGAGIGLTVARSLAQRLGGDIDLDTSYTAGARFVMALPV